MREVIPPAFPERRRLALVAAAEDRNLAATVAQRAGEHLDDRGFPRSAHREIADDHHEATQRRVVEDAMPVEPQPKLHKTAEQIRAHLQKTGEHQSGGPFPFPEDYVDAELLKFVELLAEPAIGHDVDWL